VIKGIGSSKFLTTTERIPFMSFNFFDWVRDGVKNSVLLGVSDAANTMGMPHDESSKDKILGFLKNNPEGEAPARRIGGGTVPTGQKKLGRSLNDIAAKEAS
jgi:hypothetical protein